MSTDASAENLPFEPVSTELDFPAFERRVLDFWKSREIFEKSLAARGDSARFVFYEGPPTANGLPHNGSVLTRVMKDLFPRHRAMQGRRVLRKGGWDTHGLPVEVEVEKELRIHGKQAIVEYGVEPFVARCIESVFRYTAEWARLTERLGFWVSLDDAYVTYHRSYVESVWWALSVLFEKGLLYQGHKVVWWWAQGGTALSAAEVGLGYKTVDDPSVFVLFPLVAEPDTALAVWTTTPWTLPSNAYAAVSPTTLYDVVRVGPCGSRDGEAASAEQKPLPVEKLIVASALREALSAKLGRSLEVLRTVPGRELEGARYVPPFSLFHERLGGSEQALTAGGSVATYWRVITADFVTLDAGTGIVHVAPAFGEDDHEAHKRELARYVAPEGVELLSAILPDGTFKPEVPLVAGLWVKDADAVLLGDLAARGRLLHRETYRHEYPFCWRADEDPLIQMARPGWFIRTTEKLDVALANNQAVDWLPAHIKDGRFGDFLKNNVDWALSRERFWGTPLNVWTCTADASHRHAPTSVAAIERLNPRAFDHWHATKAKEPSLSDHLMVHKPWIDAVTFPCPTCGAEMRRVSEVIDCWFDSGCMPFAQWGFPHVAGSKERFDDAFPADFISEGIDQTRGWFYSLLMISSLVFDAETQASLGLRPRELPHPYKACIVLGHVCDREGRKESKSKGNYTPPELILERVCMDFAVLDAAFGVEAAPGEVLIARDDLEGMDLADGATVALFRADRPEARQPVRVRALKKLPRRVAVVSAAERAGLGVTPAPGGLDTAAREVPGLAVTLRVSVEDESTPAPGADAFRWFFYASSPPSSNTRHSLRNVRTLQKDFLIKLRNVYSFFTIYANLDGYRPASATPRPPSERSLLDRWMLSELHLAVGEVGRALDGYLSYEAATRLIGLVDALSNWYLRRSRARFWGEGLPADKLDAYATLHEVLATLSRLIAPFVPFFAEELYQNLVVRAGLPGAVESVHLAEFPVADSSLVDAALVAEMAVVREAVSLGLSARTAEKLKVRQPLARADLVLNDAALAARLDSYRGLIAEELNVGEVRLMSGGHTDGAVCFSLKPNFRALGPRLGKRVQEVKQALATASAAALHAELASTGRLTLALGSETLVFAPEEIDVAVSASPGFAAATGPLGVVVLHTTLTEELIDEGLFRELISRVQAFRKEMQLGFSERITLALAGSARLVEVARRREARLNEECLAVAVRYEASEGARAATIDGHELLLAVERASR